LKLAETTSISPDEASSILAKAGSTALAHPVRIVEVAKRQDVLLGALFDAAGIAAQIDPEAVVTADLEIKYAGYFARERTQAERMRRMGDFALDAELDYGEMRSLSFEARQKLSRLMPISLAASSRSSGGSPGDLKTIVTAS